MASTLPDKEHTSGEDDQEIQELEQTLPKQRNWYGSDHLYYYQGFWCPSNAFASTIYFQKHFQALDTDIILTSMPKCGTTWIKALTFSIANRHRFPTQQNPLLTLNPHQLVPFLEYDLYVNNPCPDLDNSCMYRQPRMLSTHSPYPCLPPSIKHSNAKIVYICRNPMDTFISLWEFNTKIGRRGDVPLPMDEAFELFCKGICANGPFFDHVLGYWKASREDPDKILFLKYEDLKEDIIFYVKRIGEFLGFPFSEEEEKGGVVEEIARMCSFEELKELDVNKNGVLTFEIPYKAFFRKGQVGDWTNYLTPSMVERLEKLMEEKLGMSGLTFKLSV